MKVIILAGGFGTRISEESILKPKPMIEIGEKPILWHVMKHYSKFGYNDFIICCGYKQYIIKEFFSNYYLHTSDVTYDFSSCNQITIHNSTVEPWRVTIVDTGLNTMTGGRVKRVADYIKNETFMLTYGDGVSDVDISKVVDCHKEHGKIATITAIQPSGRFGNLEITNDGIISNFKEKTKENAGWINGGFMVLEPEIIKYIDGDETVFEKYPLEKVTKEGQLVAYKHNGFWQCMDTLSDKQSLERLWARGKAPWKLW